MPDDTANDMGLPKHVMQSPPGAQTVISGRTYLYFAGTGYLGLQGHPDVIRAACDAARQYGIGTATSRTGFGNSPPILDVERRAAEFFAAEGDWAADSDVATNSAFYFASGYAGIGILSRVVCDDFDVLFIDELSHYSVFEGAEAAGKPMHRFAHRDPADLERTLTANLQPGQRPLVLSDGVFALLGAIAPVAEYFRVLERYDGAGLCVDDAHAIGILGHKGRGTFEHAGLWAHGVNRAARKAPPSGPRLLMCGTLGKAIGGYGGIIAGSREFIDQIKSSSHYYSGASPPPAAAAAATAAALQLVMSQPELRSKLAANVAQMKRGLQQMGLAVDDSPTPIISLSIGDGPNMQRIQGELMERGIAIGYFAAYSGAGAEGALRIAIFATHTVEMIERLIAELKTLA